MTSENLGGVPARASLTQSLMAGTALGAALACAIAMPAYAQSQAPAQAPAQESAAASSATSTSGAPNSKVLEIPAITVEAEDENDYKTESSALQKFTAPLLDTPKTVTVIPKQLIDERNATSLQDVLRTTPGITLGAGEGGVPNADLPNIRGFAAEGNIYVDGIRDTGSQTRDMFNLEQVEVVKGPGSAYGGRGSTGGSINLVTKTPKTEDFISGDLSIGAPLSKRGTVDGNYVIADGIGLRLNALLEDRDVAGREAVETSAFGLAPSLTLGLGAPTRATLSLYHFQTDDMPDYGHPYDTTTGHPVDVDRDKFYGLVNRDFQETQIDAATLELEHDLTNDLTVRNVTRYSWSENDYIVTNPDDSAGNVVNGIVWRNVKSRNSDTTVLTNQTDLTGEFETFSLKHSFNTGVEFSWEDSKNRGYAVDTGNRNCPTTGAASGYNCVSLFDPDPTDPWSGSIGPSGSSSESSVETQSVYAFDTLELTPQWLVNGGIRFDHYYTTADSVGGRGGPFSGTNESFFVNYQLGLVFKPLPNGSIYASYGTSSDPSGMTAGDGRDNLGSSSVELDPEESRSYELGTKWDVFEEKLSVTGALFRTEKTNARIDDPAGGTSDILAGEQRIDGIEIGVAGNITDRWRVFGGYTYMDSEIVDDGPASTNDGKEIPNVPEHSLSLWTTYDFLPDWTVGGGATHMSRRYGNTANTREVSEFWRFDAVLEYRVLEDAELRLNANNIFDATYYDKPYTTHFATVAPGRSVVLTGSYKY